MALRMKIVRQYLSACGSQRRLSPKTIKAYHIDLRQFSEFLAENRMEFDRDALKAYFAILNRKFRPRTVKRKRASLRALVSWMLDERYLTQNPFENICLKIKEPQLLPRDLPLREIGGVLAAAHAQLDRHPDSSSALCETAVIEMLFATGLRVSELSDLKTADVNLADGYIRIFGKGAKERVVAIENREVLDLLRRYKDRSQPAFDGAFFHNRCGRRLSEQSVRGIVRKYTRSAGIATRITPHMFRHSLATMLVNAEVPIRFIQRILGHASIQTTQIYTRVAGQRQREILAAKHPRNLLSFPLTAEAI